MITKDFDLEDSFLLSEIIDKMDIELEIKKIMDDMKDETGDIKLDNVDEEQLGKEMFLNLGIDLSYKAIKKLYKAKKEVKKLICSLTDKTMSEVAKMSLKDIKLFFKELVEHEGFKDFLN